MNRKNAFTLIELLTVIAIMALLAGLLLPALQKAREKAKVAKCISAIASLQTALSMYQVDYGMYPQSATGILASEQHNGNSHHTDFNGAPNNFVAAMTKKTLGGPYIEFKGKDLLESGTNPENMYVLKDPWGQAYIYVCQKDIGGNNVHDNRGPFHPDDSGTEKYSNTYNIYSLGPDKMTDDDDTSDPPGPPADYIAYSQDGPDGDGDDWNFSDMFDSDECGHWNDEDIDSKNFRYDDINSWDGSRSF